MCTMLDQRRRRLANVVQMIYKCFVFAGHLVISSVADINAVNLYSIGYYMPELDCPTHAHFAVECFFNLPVIM